MPKNPELWLRPGADRRIKSGHCWVYSNEVDSKRSPFSGFTAGDPVTVHSASGAPLASAYMEPQSLICARLYSRRPDCRLDAELLEARVRSALALRQRFYHQPFYRLIYGDSDGVSGVVADRFGDYLVVQLNTAGSDRFGAALVEALVTALEPAGVLIRRDSRSRQELGLECPADVAWGDVPEEVEIEENGCRFLVPVRSGQKTGWFYDHRENRAVLASLCEGSRVLDVYSYLGGWGIQAARAGARSVTCVDNAAVALTGVEANAQLNGVDALVTTLQGRADQVLRQLAAQEEQFDIVVLDPPAFVQRRRDLAKGRKAYQRMNELALGVMAPRGLLVSASCSMHLPEEDLVAAMGAAARRKERRLRIARFGGQGADHPVLPLVPESRYLKAVFAEVTPSD